MLVVFWLISFIDEWWWWLDILFVMIVESSDLMVLSSVKVMVFGRILRMSFMLKVGRCGIGMVLGMLLKWVLIVLICSLSVVVRIEDNVMVINSFG